MTYTPTFAEERLDELSDAVNAQKHAEEIPPETCQLIDKVIRSIQKALKMADGKHREDEADALREMLSDIAWELCGLTDTMEEIRTHNGTLRQLGKDWATIATNALRDAKQEPTR